MRGIRHPPETRQRVVALLRDGHSVNETARQTGVSPSSVSSIGREGGVRLTHTRAERMREAARDFDHIARLEAINTLAARIRELVEESDDLTARELRDASVALGVAIDKARLERGEEKVVPQYQSNVVVVVGDNGRGPLPAGAVQVHRSFPAGH